MDEWWDGSFQHLMVLMPRSLAILSCLSSEETRSYPVSRAAAMNMLSYTEDPFEREISRDLQEVGILVY